MECGRELNRTTGAAETSEERRGAALGNSSEWMPLAFVSQAKERKMCWCADTVWPDFKCYEATQDHAFPAKQL